MRVLFIRHATAVDKGAPGQDMERPLAPEGRQESRELCAALSRVYGKIDVIVSSEALRALETAEILSDGFGQKRVVRSRLLNPGSGFKEFRKIIADLPADTEIAAWVGHEPDISHIVAHIVADGALRIHVKKASCIEVEINRLCKGELNLMLTPKALAKLAK